MKKIQQIIILLAVLTFAAASNSAKAQELINSNIALGVYNNNDYIPQSAIDTVWGLTHIPKGYEVKCFSVSASIKGFHQEATSNSAKLTDEQRSIMSQTFDCQKIYIEDIRLLNTTNNKLIEADPFRLVKSNAKKHSKGIHSADVDCYDENENHPKIRVMLPCGIADHRYIVQSFRIEAINPNYVFSYEIQGDQIDSATWAKLAITSGYIYDLNFTIKNIKCTEIATGKDVYAPDIQPYKEHFGCVCRSKNYFLSPKSKIDFFYKPDFKIDSVAVECRKHANTNIFRFKGDVFSKDLKAFVKNIEPFATMHFYIFHDGKFEKVPVMVIE